MTLITDLVHVGSPPTEIIRGAGVENGKEDDDASDGYRTIQRGTQNKVKSMPPAGLALLNKDAK